MLLFVLLVAFVSVIIETSTEESCIVSPTGEDIPGPFYIPGAPNRAALYNSTSDGIKLNIVGHVSNLECEALSNVYIDFWQADPMGRYDSNGYSFRGGVYTDDNGRYQVSTLKPGIYSNRPSHIHVKVFIEDTLKLTTQIYFDGYSGSDPWFDQKRAMVLHAGASGSEYSATFNFIGDWTSKSSNSSMDTTTIYTTRTTTKSSEISFTTSRKCCRNSNDDKTSGSGQQIILYSFSAMLVAFLALIIPK